MILIETKLRGICHPELVVSTETRDPVWIPIFTGMTYVQTTQSVGKLYLDYELNPLIVVKPPT